LTLGELADRWLELKRERGDIGANTYHQYRNGLNKFKPLFKQRLDKITALQVDSIYSQMLKDGLSPRSVQVAHRSLHGALKQAVAWELIGRNVLDAVRVPKQVKPDIACWTSDEVIRFLTLTQPHRLYALFYTALATGMRRGEIVALRWHDVDLSSGRITIKLNAVAVMGQTPVKEPKSKASRRTIFIQDEDVAVLKAHRVQQLRERELLGPSWTDHDLVFPSQVGTHLSPRNLSRLFEQLVRQSGVTRAGFHSMRHAHASLLIKNGVDDGVVSERLGHTDPGFTRRVYQHLFDEQRNSAALGLMNLIRNTRTQTPPN
jgi:integrase